MSFLSFAGLCANKQSCGLFCSYVKIFYLGTPNPQRCIKLLDEPLFSNLDGSITLNKYFSWYCAQRLERNKGMGAFFELVLHSNHV